MSGASLPSLGDAGGAAERGKAISHRGSESRRARTLPTLALSERGREEQRPIGLDTQTYVRTAAAAAGFVFEDGEDGRWRGERGGCVAKCMTAVFVGGVRRAFAEASNGIKHDRQNVKGPVWMIGRRCVVHADCLRAGRAAVYAGALRNKLGVLERR